MVHIRQATPEDAALIADFSRDAFYQAFAADNTPENMEKFLKEQFTRENLMEEVSAGAGIFLMAYVDDVLAGYARLRQSHHLPALGDRPVIEIARIYMAAQLTGKGIGSVLMQACVQTAIDLGKEVIWLGVWEHNERAIAFYQRFGFEKFGEHIFMLGDDPQTDWLMKKTITTDTVAGITDTRSRK